MKSVFSALKNKLINLYIAPLQKDYNLGLSVRNRIFRNDLHLIGLIVSLQKINKNKHKGLLLDIGCHTGGTSCRFAKDLKELQVIGFEPIKKAFESAGQKAHLYPNLKFENIALSDKDGVVDFFITDNEVSSSLNSINTNQQFSVAAKQEVKTYQLDTYLQENNLQDEKILGLKIDVQGHEMNVLKGAEKSLKNTLLILLEMSNHNDYKNGTKYYEVDAYLRSKGFALQNIFTCFSTGQVYEYDAMYINEQIQKEYI